MSYTPIPLITVELGRKNAQNAQSELQAGLSLSYRFGVPWVDQINKDAVEFMRSLAGSRYDLVDRNYNIVMQYEKQELITLALPENITAFGADSVPLSGSVVAKYGADHVEWSAPALVAAGGSLTPSTADPLSVQITFPPYQATRAANSYQVSGVAYDVRGNRSNTATTTLLVKESPVQLTLVHMGSGDPVALANGSDLIHYGVTVVDSSTGLAVAGQVVAFEASLAEEVVSSSNPQTNAQGKTEVFVRHIKAGDGVIDARLANGNRISSPIKFTADAASAVLAKLIVVDNGAAADGIATNKVRATVTDANGNLIEGISVGFNADNGAVIAGSGTTEANGEVEMPLMSSRAGTSTVMATLNGSNATVETHFVADITTATIASLTVTTDGAIANGTASNIVQATVIDIYGNPVSNAVVAFNAGNGALIAGSGTTDGNGKVDMPLTNTRAGISTVTAALSNGANGTIDTTFVADGSTAAITGSNLTVTADNALANGTATNGVQARVMDANSNPVSGQTVTFTASNGATVTTVIGTTGADGLATVTLTNTAVGMTQVTATVNGSSQVVATIFVADAGTASVSLAVEVSSMPADGIASNSVKATVVDAFGNPVPGISVNFLADNSATVAATGTTGADGTVAVTLVSVTPGDSSVTATVNSTSDIVVVEFVPVPFSVKFTLTM